MLYFVTVHVYGLFSPQACIDENSDMVEFLVESGSDVSRGDNEGWTPLHAAASCGFIQIAKWVTHFHNLDIQISFRVLVILATRDSNVCVLVLCQILLESALFKVYHCNSVMFISQVLDRTRRSCGSGEQWGRTSSRCRYGGRHGETA